MTVPSNWERSIPIFSTHATTPAPRIVVCGPKGAGKSTYAKLLANHILTARTGRTAWGSGSSGNATVAWLDLDPGQPEYTPPGQLSLTQLRTPVLGPAFTHPYNDCHEGRRLLKAHNLGATSPKENPAHFLRCVEDLIQRYNQLTQEYPNCSLVVNSPGWVIGTGLDLLLGIITRTAAKEIVYLGPNLPQAIDSLKAATPSVNVQLVIPASAGDSFAPRTAAELRTMQTVSHFHQNASKDSWNSSCITPLEQQQPKTLSFSKGSAEIHGVLLMADRPANLSLVETMLDRVLVAVCLIDGDSKDGDVLKTFAKTDVNGLDVWTTGTTEENSALDPRKSHMLGVAYIQSLDFISKCVQLQTPISWDFLHHQTTTSNGHRPAKVLLVHGGFEPPAWAYLEAIYLKSYHGKKMDQRSRQVGHREDLGLDQDVLRTARNGTNFNDDNEIDLPPYVRKIGRDEAVLGQRWRVRSDVGRPAKQKTKSRSA